MYVSEEQEQQIVSITEHLNWCVASTKDSAPNDASCH